MTRKALGRGLEALIPTRPATDGESEPKPGSAAAARVPLEVDIDRIRPNRYQPRRRFDAAKIDGLAASVRRHGLLQPLVVSRHETGFELIAGERRLRAARLAGLQRVPVYVREVDAGESLRLALLENVQREDLNPIEEAGAYRRLIDEFNMTQQDIADELGKSRSAVANALRLLQLPEELQERIRGGELTAGHARALLAAGTLEEQRALAGLVRERGLSVREAEQLVQQKQRRSPARRQRAPVNPALQELERRLETRFGTRVRIRARKGDGSSGRVEIEYYSPTDLERVFEIAGVAYLL